MKKKFAAFLFLSLSALMFVTPASAQLHRDTAIDQETREGLGRVFDTDKEIEETLPGEVGRIINVVLSIVGVIMLAIIVYAGVLWLTAGGNEDQVKKAQRNIRNAIIGLIIIMASFMIVQFVISRLETAFAPTTAQVDLRRLV